MDKKTEQLLFNFSLFWDPTSVGEENEAFFYKSGNLFLVNAF